jgi:hypothetical protein
VPEKFFACSIAHTEEVYGNVTTHTLRKCEMPPGGTKALFGSSTEHRARAGGTLGHLASRLHTLGLALDAVDAPARVRPTVETTVARNTVAQPRRRR